MGTQRTFGRLIGAAALGLVSFAACAGAANPPPSAGGGADDAWVGAPGASGGSAVEETRREADREKDRGDAGAPGDAGPRCPYGELSDPHRGFIRCLLPEERDAGWLPPPPQEPAQPEPSKDAADAGKPAAAPPPPSAPPPVVELGAPKFENGEVPKAEKALTAALGDIGKCVADHGGLSGATGSLKVQFLVRARGRAEGVEVLSAKGVGSDAAACVRVLLKNKSVGAPTADPVGVTVTISLKAAGK